MIQPIYTSVSNADIVPCNKKGQIIKSDPIPLLRNNYLGEYRTELEKEKVRKNLGIADDISLRWENIKGFVDDSTELVKYIKSTQQYTSELSDDIKTIQDGLTYALYYVTNFKGEHEAVEQLQQDIIKVNSTIDDVKKEIYTNIGNRVDTNATSIQTINELINGDNGINAQLEILNNKLLTINVDANILAWVKSKLESSQSIELTDSSLEVKISQKEDNDLILDEGLYIKSSAKYKSDLNEDSKVPYTVGGIEKGTTLKELYNKSVTEILDLMLFPTATPTLIYPTIKYSSLPPLVKVGSALVKPTLSFTQGHSGGVDGEPIEEIYDPNNTLTTSETYSIFGKYIFKASQKFLDGEELLDNRGNPTGSKVTDYTATTEISTTAVYPWYVSYDGGTSKIEQPLIAFGASNEIEFSLQGKCQILLPGSNSEINSFKVDSGLGYIEVDLENGWNSVVTIPLNGIYYKVWSKKIEYSNSLPHKIKFTLAL